jgi:hypothetical protein
MVVRSREDLSLLLPIELYNPRVLEVNNPGDQSGKCQASIIGHSAPGELQLEQVEKRV